MKQSVHSFSLRWIDYEASTLRYRLTFQIHEVQQNYNPIAGPLGKSFRDNNECPDFETFTAKSSRSSSSYARKTNVLNLQVAITINCILDWMFPFLLLKLQ